MNEEFWRWYMYGHWICLAQWLGFIMVEYAYLGKGRVKHPLVWSGVITMLTMTLSVVYNFGFFTPRAVALTILFLFITVMLFGGTPGQKFTACLINGTMCLLVENSMRYVISWILKCELQQVIQRADCLIIIAHGWNGRGSSAMNEEFWRWYMYGHWICLAQWLGFIMVEYAYLGKGRVKHPLVWSGVITMLTMTLSVVYNFGFFTPRAVALTILFLFITVMLFGGTPGQKFTACLINGTMCLLVENSMRYVISWILKCELQQVIQRADCLIIIAVANMVVGAAVAFLVGKWRRRNALEPLQALTMSFFPGVVVVLNILLMLTDNNKRATMATMGMTVGLTVAVMVHLCIVAMFNDQVMQRRSLHFQAELEQQRASALLDSYTAQRRLTHEFTNHISALRALLAQGDVGGAQDYIAGVDKAVAASTTIMDTHNPLLDSILTRKYEEATRQGVSVYFDLCDLRDFPLSGVDMVTVLANLLDNAICAAAQAYPPEVYVRVRKTEVEYLLSVRNRVQRDVELPPDGQLPRTTRKEPGHGMGLSNVRDVLLRHGAEYTLSCRDNWFRFTCAVPTGNS